MAINTYFKNIADAIREKTGGSALITPGQMPQEILNIPAGGNNPLTPLHYDLNNGCFVAPAGQYGNMLRQDNSNNYYMDVYRVEAGKSYLVSVKNPKGNRLRCGLYNIDPAELIPPSSGRIDRADSLQALQWSDTIYVYTAYLYDILYDGYFCIMKTSLNIPGYISCVCEV